MALGYMRRHRRWLYAFLWIVILGFIVFYIPAFRNVDAGSPGESVGSVAGASISASEFQRAYLQRRQMYERVYRVDPAMLRSLGLEEQVFEGLVAQKLVEVEARRLGLRVGDEELARSIQTAPELQENGRFIGAAELRRRLDLGGQSIAEFEESRRERLLVEKLQALVAAGVSVSPAEVEREFRRRNEQVKLEYVLVDAARFRNQATADDAEVKTRFESKKDSYKLPEKRVVSFLLIDPAALAGRVSVTDRDIEGYYRERPDEFRQEEEVCASHILVKVQPPGGKEGHSEAEAKKLAESVLQRARAGADFAALAKKESEDKGSSANGGDVGCFGRGRFAPEFDNAVFSLEAGQITPELVKTPSGYHVIKLAAHREQSLMPLAQVKERIRQMLLQQHTRTLADEQAQTAEARLRKSGSLEDAAQALGLTVQKSQPLARGEASPPLGSAALVARAFELKPNEVERQAFALPSGGTAFIALAEIQAPRLPELKEVQERVKAELIEEKALERTRALAEDLRARAEKLGLDKAAAALTLVRKETPGLVARGAALGDLGTSAPLEDAAFSLPEKAVSEPVRVAAGYAVLRVLEKKAFDPQAFEKEKDQVAASVKQTRRSQFFQAYVAELRQRAIVDKRPDVLKRITG